MNGDVRRGRALLVGASVAALATLVTLLLLEGPGAVVSPGALSPLHVRAGVGCSDCHGEREAGSSCSGCHVGHESRRPGHRELGHRGELGCADCHRSHGAESVTLSTSEVSAHAFPLVEQRRCDSCHRASEPADPAFHCFSPGSRFSLCFDEHARPAAIGASRSAAAERARAQVLSSVTGSGTGGRKGTLSAFVALTLGIVGFVIAARSRASSRRSAKVSTPESAGHRRLPVIDAARCLGCNACVDACPHDVLEVQRFVAKVARPEACCGLVLCAERCPNGSLVITQGEPLERRARLSPDLESLDQPGLFLAGDVAGQSLIRSAVEQGERAARAAHASLARAKGARGFDVDLLVIGAGPAGLSAGLAARALGLDVVVWEQARLAESIRSFPRGKLVLDGGTPDRDLPLFVAECEKEELVRRWLRTVRTAGLSISEGTRVASVVRREGAVLGFRVEAERESGEVRAISARRVIVAVGQRGSPRRLEAEVPFSAQAKVHYFLSDARTFAGRRSVVVGLGDTAMEAAIALAAQPGSDVTVVYRGAAFKRGKRKNLERMQRLEAQGKIRLLWSSEVREVDIEHLTLATPEGEEALLYDAVFVLIGSLPDSDFLRRIGFGSGRNEPSRGGRRALG